MSMWDTSYCATNCNRKDCARNLKFHKPEFKYYSVACFDEEDVNATHENCKCIIRVDKED